MNEWGRYEKWEPLLRMLIYLQKKTLECCHLDTVGVVLLKRPNDGKKNEDKTILKKLTFKW